VENVTVRGVSGRPFDVRPEVKVVDGERFRPGTAEVIVGKALSGRIRDAQIGGTIRQAGQTWKVDGRGSMTKIRHGIFHSVSTVII